MQAESRREYNRRWRAANPDKCAAYTKKYRAKVPLKVRERVRNWYHKNLERNRDYHRRWRKGNSAKVNEASKRWRSRNPDKQKQAQRNWMAANRDVMRANARHRTATDLNFRIAKNLRCRINWAIRRTSAKKYKRTMTLVGCEVPFLMGYLESQFRPEMNWGNYGTVWEIDHIRPCASYDLTIEANQVACFHYTNLQPLFVPDNRKKHAKFPARLALTPFN